MKSVTVSVPGKIFLMGEHVVVYGKPALVAAVNRRLEVTAEAMDNSESEVEISSVEPDEYIRHAIDTVSDTLKLGKIRGLRISVSSDIKPGYHLGSSAAVAVGVVGAVMYFFTGIWNPVEINRIAYEVEKKQHGTPSGVDNTAVTMGGFIWYRRELEFLKSIWQLPLVIPSGVNRFFLIDTGRPAESTGEMVAFVRARYLKEEYKLEKLFAENERQTKRMAVALKSGDIDTVCDAMRIGEMTLEKIGVVSPKARRVIHAVTESGGAAKILGGGGRRQGVGYLLAFHPDPEKLAASLKKVGCSPEPLVLGGEGIQLERKIAV